jgi:N-acetylneuraminate synthase
MVKLDNHVHFCAEIGINALGSVEIAKSLIDFCVDAGVDVVKFQKRTVNIVYPKEELDVSRDSPYGVTNGDLKRQLEFSYEDYKEIDRYCNKKGIQWTASPWDTQAVSFLNQFDLPYIKIASATITNKELLQACCETGKPLFVSTGMCDLKLINKVVKTINNFGGDIHYIYHCTSTYPTADDEFNLLSIPTLIKTFPNIRIGYSGHELGHLPTLLAVALGAQAVERHITLNEDMYGSDQKASYNVSKLKELVENIARVKTMLGNGELKIYDSEIPIMAKLRRINTI